MDKLIEKFYNAFTNLDAETMADCYHPDVVFEDPAFGTLQGERAKNMWRMLCSSQKGKNFIVTFSEIKTNKNNGSAKWEAIYNFSKTGRKVHNKISAKFEFKDGLIIRHKDNFNLHKWATQAIGFKGKLLGSTGFFRKKLQKQTNSLLDKFEVKL
ncbi:limonene-1,2-epoxide hydrolase [Winogradskyella sp. PC-19]|uniref:nuclear transport factor 2 family protein n=1 Tax=unclassified Winogradskyella TaxID=2615021 RepID=UPI000B3C01B8|nr:MULTISPECIES: nuclear transport factor 2 family protein [unclassified Winogradskyella]ARV08699.1 limonene-1,2-epoxide hydrolase [Winogradskyella sp. PC-19]